MGSVGVMISAVASRDQKKREEGCAAMACRTAGTRDHVEGEERSGYWSLWGKKVR